MAHTVAVILTCNLLHDSSLVSGIFPSVFFLRAFGFIRLVTWCSVYANEIMICGPV